jgi:molybdenum cofactor biosynthesis protein B
MSKTATEHKAEAPTSLRFAIVTISTSRYRSRQAGESVADPSGDLIVQLLESANHKVTHRKLVPDKAKLIVKAVKEALSNKTVDAVVACGGTGITQSDLTIEAVRPLFKKELPGFGELLRKISYEKIGSPAVMTRAVAGVTAGKAIFCIPGSPQAVETALKELVIPEVGHIIKHAKEK